ncbi:hypothetical protein [Streptomyces microflavus]|uniref:hypothetical protein n=1 Tax=Streptomyces microflavus TaxID=1919 RepID=UPI00339DDEFC
MSAAAARGADVYAADAEPGMVTIWRAPRSPRSDPDRPRRTGRRPHPPRLAPRPPRTTSPVRGKGSRPCSARPGSWGRSAPRSGGPEPSRIGATGQVLNSRGPEGVAAARGAYEGLCVEFRTPGGQLRLPRIALLGGGRA